MPGHAPPEWPRCTRGKRLSIDGIRVRQHRHEQSDLRQLALDSHIGETEVDLGLTAVYINECWPMPGKSAFWASRFEPPLWLRYRFERTDSESVTMIERTGVDLLRARFRT